MTITTGTIILLTTTIVNKETVLIFSALPYSENRQIRTGLLMPSLGVPSRPPMELVWVVDVSSSMNEIGHLDPEFDTSLPTASPPWSTFSNSSPSFPLNSSAFSWNPTILKNSPSISKIEQVRRSLTQYVSLLRDSDRVTLISFNDQSRILFSGFLSGENRSKLLEAILSLQAFGGTSIQAGLTSALQSLSKPMNGMLRRILLLSDGQPNYGWSHPEHFKSYLKDLQSHCVSLSSMGVGLHYNEFLLSQLAHQGQGLFAHLTDPDSFSRWIHREYESMTQICAARTWIRVQYQGDLNDLAHQDPSQRDVLWVEDSIPGAFTLQQLWPNSAPHWRVFEWSFHHPIEQLKNPKWKVSLQWQDLEGHVHHSEQSFTLSDLDHSTCLQPLEEMWAIHQAQNALLQSLQSLQKGDRQEAQQWALKAQSTIDPYQSSSVNCLKSMTQHYYNTLNNPSSSLNCASKIATESHFIASHSYRTQDFKSS